ncbi:21423_t:CDS:2, partial [Cetraspora pellucida]
MNGKIKNWATNIIILDLHIIEQIRNTNVYNAKGQQIANKKIRYANGFRKMKKALNTALDLGCKQKLINMVTCFVDQKKFELENINNEDTHSGQPEEMQSHKELAHNYSAINLQDPNLRVPLSIVNSNSNSNNSVDNIKD